MRGKVLGLCALLALGAALTARAETPFLLLFEVGRPRTVRFNRAFEEMVVGSPALFWAATRDHRSVTFASAAPGQTTFTLVFADGSRREYQVRVAR